MGGTTSVFTTQQRTIPLAAMNPNCRKALKSVTRRPTYEAAEATAAMTVGCQVARTAVRRASATGTPRRRSSKYRDW